MLWFRILFETQMSKIWNKVENTNCLQLLDVLQMMGASTNKPPQGWLRVVWFLGHVLAFTSFCTMMLTAVQTFSRDYGFSASVTHVVLAGCVFVILLELFVMWYYADSIQQSLQYIDSEPIASGDALHDETVRRTFDRLGRFGVSAILISIPVNQVLWTIVPKSHRDTQYPYPWDHYVDSSLVLFIHDISQYWFTFICTCRNFWISAKLLVHLLGLQAEQKILAHKFEQDLLRIKSEISSASFDSRYYIQRQQARNAFWKQLKSDIGQTLQLHYELIRQVELLRPAISKVFFLFYSFGVIGYGSLAFVMMDERMSLIPLVLGLIAILIFGYFWCRLVDNFKETNESIHGTIYEMCANLPYDKENASEYRQMRSSLMIIALYVANTGQLMSGGFVNITMSTYANILDTSFTLLKFLLGARET